MNANELREQILFGLENFEQLLRPRPRAPHSLAKGLS